MLGGSVSPPGQIPLKVPNIEFDFDVSVDRERRRSIGQLSEDLMSGGPNVGAPVVVESQHLSSRSQF